MTIQTIEDLLEFVDTHYEKLTDEQYVLLCRETMHLYEYRKPRTKQATLDRILDLYAFSEQYKSIQELPLFLN